MSNPEHHIAISRQLWEESQQFSEALNRMYSRALEDIGYSIRGEAIPFVRHIQRDGYYEWHRPRVPVQHYPVEVCEHRYEKPEMWDRNWLQGWISGLDHFPRWENSDED